LGNGNPSPQFNFQTESVSHIFSKACNLAATKSKDTCVNIDQRIWNMAAFSPCKETAQTVYNP